jgi:hypothetical protein
MEAPVTVHEITFGDTACEVHITNPGPTLYIAQPYVWENGGKALRALANRDGAVVECPLSTEDGALGRAVEYLESRFGSRGPDPERHRGTHSVRPILEPPLRDERPPSSN